jgi:hypothetical protein
MTLPHRTDHLESARLVRRPIPPGDLPSEAVQHLGAT